MRKANVLIIADPADVEFLDTALPSKQWNIFLKIVDYERLYKSARELSDAVNQNAIDILAFSRNDQVCNRVATAPMVVKLRTGYTSFSGIDEAQRTEQMAQCFEDFVKCDKMVRYDGTGASGRGPGNTQGERTFSLVFDLEQVGGVKYGLPRILALLDQYKVRATFFITDLINTVYPNCSRLIAERGHEVGLHGLWHEDLRDVDLLTQKKYIDLAKSRMAEDCRGANYLYRTDVNTVNALIVNQLNYLICDSSYYYRPFAYPEPPEPLLIEAEEGTIYSLPISIDIYGFPWFLTKNMVDASLAAGKRQRFVHLTLLCHLFRDASIRNIERTEKLLRYLVIAKGLTSITLSDLLENVRRSGSVRRIEAANIFVNRSKSVIRIPRTREDVIGCVPHNFVHLMTILSGRHEIF
jgi:peptidoglycan/xylan/chitin deacetylase (PgdA/CDA1 family)